MRLAPGSRRRAIRRDRVGRGRLAGLVLAVVAGDRAVRRLGLDGVTVGRHQDAGHQAERAEALGHGVGLDVAVVVLAGPDEPAVAPLERGRDHVVDEAVLVGDAGGLEPVFTHLGPMPPVTGSMNVVKLLTEGLEDVVGATFAVEADPQKASRILIRHIEKKRKELRLDAREVKIRVPYHWRPAALFQAAGQSSKGKILMSGGRFYRHLVS